MAERLVISVDASSHDPDHLKVQDVFQHILELFTLVSESDPGAEGEIVWRLVGATMNSPFTVIAEASPAMPSVPQVEVDICAKRQKREFAKNYASLRSGMVPSAWSSGNRRRVAKSLMSRNHNGIGKTSINFGLKDENIADVELTHNDAEIAIHALDVAPFVDLGVPKQQVGSVEGRMVEVLTYYGKPAIRLKERRTGNDVICVVPEDLKHQIAEGASLEDVWNGRRVVVRGVITYNDNHTISRVTASHIRSVDAKDIPLENIQDKTFTDGMSVKDYLERLREGTLG